MNVGIIVLALLFIIFQFSFTMLDLQKNTNMKNDVFESLRAADQNALIEVQDKFDNYEKISSVEMLEKWLINYCNNNSMDFSEVKVSFIVWEEDPPVLLAFIKGKKDSYFILTGEAAASYYNGVMILPKGEEK